MFNLKEFNVQKFDSILGRGLCSGIGQQGSQVCIEAAICETLGLPHGDEPGCVSAAVRSFKITLNDSRWSSPAARANGLRALGIAQLGSLGVVDDVEFSKRLAEKTVRVLIPKLFRDVFKNNKTCLEAAARCEEEGSKYDDAADAARAAAADAAYAARAAAYASAHAAASADAAAYAAAAARAAAYAAASAADAASARAAGDIYLLLIADLALEVLRELNSPGIELL